MSVDENKQQRRVGVYDRPASADRPRRAWLALALMALIAAAVVLYFFWRL